jgi:ribokinase
VRCAVVGHVEWTEFVQVPRVPTAGEIVHATGFLAEPGGAGAVAARQLALLAGGCELFTALGDDETGRLCEARLRELGVEPRVQWGGRSRRAWVHVDDDGERTITVLGDKLFARGPLPLDGYDAVFFVSGDVDALRSARRARFLAATPRELATLKEAGVPIELLVGSAFDPGESYDGSLEVATLVQTEGAAGGTANGEWYPAELVSGAVVDTYGAGDSFAAALCFALARGEALTDALRLAARAGAAVVTARGPYAGQLGSEA